MDTTAKVSSGEQAGHQESVPTTSGSRLNETLSDAFNSDWVLTHLVGSCGLWQWSLVVISILTIPPSATFPVFANSEPHHRCRMEPSVEAYFEQQNMSFDMIARLSEPDAVGNMQKGCCRFNVDWTNLTWLSSVINNHSYLLSRSVEPCPNGYVYRHKANQYPAGVVAEFDTVCEYHWLTPLSTSLYILGMLIGFLTGGWCSDRIGRRQTAMMYSVVELLAGLTVSLAPRYTVYVIGRTFVACAITGKVLALSVLQMEITVARHRSILNATTSLGHNFLNRSLVSLYAYLIPHWRLLNAAIMAPTLFSFLYLWIPESPRWLCSQNRQTEAVKVFISGYRLNNRKHLDPSIIAKLQRFSSTNDEPSKENIGCHRTTTKLWRRRTASRTQQPKVRVKSSRSAFFKIAAIGSILFSGNVFCYFGLLFYARITNLPVYLTAFINSTTAIPGTLLFALLYHFARWRKAPVLGLYLIASVVLTFGAIYSYFWNTGRDVVLTVCANIALTLLGASLSMLYVFIPELFPSSIRTQGLGFASGVGRIGGLWCTFVNHFHRYLTAGFPLLIYGVVLLITAGILWFVKDTDGENLVDSIPVVVVGGARDAGELEESAQQ